MGGAREDERDQWCRGALWRLFRVGSPLSQQLVHAPRGVPRAPCTQLQLWCIRYWSLIAADTCRLLKMTAILCRPMSIGCVHFRGWCEFNRSSFAGLRQTINYDWGLMISGANIVMGLWLLCLCQLDGS